jgi:AcrR family transcriptional regulator
LVEQRNRSKREQREERILAATAQLVEQFGYKKTTIDDIARKAGVGKGTIYLHWKTREDLFMALLMHEMKTLIAGFLNHLIEDPDRATLRSIIHYAISMTLQRSLVKSLVKGDTEMVVPILHTRAGTDIIEMRMQSGRAFLGLLRHYGLMRTDQDIDTQIKRMVAITMGFFVSSEYVPEELRFDEDEIASTLADIMHDIFEPPEPPPSEAVQEVARLMISLFQHFLVALEARISEE